MDKRITSQEINSLRFYQGDISHYKMNTEEDFKRYNSQFYRTKGGYHILNMLLYPNMENERTRICLEKKMVPVCLLNDIKELINIYRDIFTLMCKIQSLKIRGEVIHAYRKDRMQSIDMINNGCTYSFTSCSLNDECEDYFMKKNGILLLEFDIPNSIPYIILNDVIKGSSFQYQEEILLPPFLAFDKSVLSITKKEQKYRDINNESPKAKYLLKATHLSFNEQRLYKVSDKESEMRYIFEEEALRASNIIKGLAEGCTIEETDKLFYCSWKMKIQQIVQMIFFNIYKSFCGEK